MNVEFTERLIQAVRRRPVLYQLGHPDFKNATKKLEAWREIQMEMDEEVAALKAKWKNLRDTYKKHQHARHSSGAPSTRKLQHWTWAEHMRFLDPPEDIDDAASSVITLGIEYEDDPLSDKTSNKDDTKDTETDHKQDTPTSPSVRRHRNKPVRYVTRRKVNSDKVEVKCDGVDLLFLGYADSFKKLSKRKQIQTKYAIAKILMRAELGDMDGVNYASFAPHEAHEAPEHYLMADEADIKVFNNCT
ncbi:hypothetical protein ACJJTC_010800 [Scirpophaga incertulas]